MTSPSRPVPLAHKEICLRLEDISIRPLTTATFVAAYVLEHTRNRHEAVNVLRLAQTLLDLHFSHSERT